MIFNSTKLRIKSVSRLEQRTIKLAKQFGLYKNDNNQYTTRWYQTIISLLKTLKHEYNFELKPISNNNFTKTSDDKLTKVTDLDETLKSSDAKTFLSSLTTSIHDEINTTYDNDNFIDKFNKELFCITTENLDYLNQTLNSLNNNRVNITLEQLYSIQKLAFTLNKLTEKGITTKSYASKVTSYNKLRYKALDEFGVYMKKSPPFSNPTVLYKDLDIQLSEIGLDKEQKKEFYSWFNIRERVPKQSITKLKLEEKKFEELVSDYHNLLSHEEHMAIITKDKSFNFSHTYYNLLEKYHLDEIPRSVIYYENNNMSENDEIAIEDEIESWQLDREKEILLDSIFLHSALFQTNLQELLKNGNMPLIIKAIEKYKLYQYMKIDENILHLHKNIPSS